MSRLKRVVVVDDDRDLRVLVQLVFAYVDAFELAVFGRADDEAFEAALGADVVVSDFKMDYADGLDFLERLRAAGADGTLILWSAWPELEPDELERMDSAGVRFVQKSDDLVTVLLEMGEGEG